MSRPAAHRTVGVATVAVGLVVVIAVAWWRVPWSPVPGGTPAAAPVSDVFTASQVARAEEFSGWARLWSRLALLSTVLVACWFGFGAAGRRLVRRLPGPWWLQVPAVVLLLTLAGRLLALPFSVLLRRRLLDDGLSTQPWSGFARDLVVQLLVEVVATSLALLVLMACVRRWRRAWPAVAGLLAAGLVVLGSFVYPLVVEPLFNTFEPLPDGALRTSILQLADQEGVAVDDVLVADASRRTTTLNAYVSGFGGSRRVVVYDNLVDDTDQREILSVVAHELAHAKYDDVLTGTLIGAGAAAAAVGLLSLLVGRRRLGDPEQVAWVLAVVAVAGVLVLPAQNAISRRIETRADVTALETTGDPDAFVELQRDLALRSLADPTPPAWSQWWFGSHPTSLQRVAIAEAISSRTGPSSR